MGNAFGKNDSANLNGEIELRHFNLLRCIGKGAFGKVRIVEHKEKKKLYALKYINKMQCIKIKATQNIMRERAILEEIEHPFIVNLRFAFQDDENMFMVLDLMIGGDLRFHLERLGGFSEEMLRFYCAELSCALNYLHNKGIIHRDLKPDNILLDDKGHSHITDFNIAVHIEPNRKPRSQSGTISYMAPEVFSGKGYSYPVDWWSLGVVLYECFYGRRPFKGHTNEQISSAIVNQKDIHYPSANYITKHIVNPTMDFLSMMRGLLTKDISKRIGSGINGMDELWDHTWFRGIDWDKLERKEYTAPLIPDPDKANFDATYDLEELLLEDNPLTYRPRKKKNKKEKEMSEDSGHINKQNNHGNKSVNNSSSPKSRIQTELEYIEEHFKTFDSTLLDRFSQILESDRGDAEETELVRMLEEEYKNLSATQQQVEVNGRKVKNTHGPSGAVTASTLREKKLRIQTYRARMQMKQESAMQDMNPNPNYIPPRVKSSSKSSLKNVYNNSGYNTAMSSPGSTNQNSSRSSPVIHGNIMQQQYQYDEMQQSYNKMIQQQQQQQLNRKLNENTLEMPVNGGVAAGGPGAAGPGPSAAIHGLQFPLPPQYGNTKTPPPPPSQPPPSQPLPPTPDKINFFSNNNSQHSSSQEFGSLGRPGSASSKRNNKGSASNIKSYGVHKNQQLSEKPKSGSYPQLNTNDRKRQQQQQQQQQMNLKQKYASSPKLHHQKLTNMIKERERSQSHLKLSRSNDSSGFSNMSMGRQLSNISLHQQQKNNKDEDYNSFTNDNGHELNISSSKSLNNLNFSNRSIEDINIFSKDELEEMNDSLKFERVHRYNNSVGNINLGVGNMNLEDQGLNLGKIPNNNNNNNNNGNINNPSSKMNTVNVNNNNNINPNNNLNNNNNNNNPINNNNNHFLQMANQKESIITPLLTEEEIANIGNVIGNISINDSVNNNSIPSSPLFHNSNTSSHSINKPQQLAYNNSSTSLKRINHGKSYDNLNYGKSFDSGILNNTNASNYMRYEPVKVLPMKQLPTSSSSIGQGNTPAHSRSNTASSGNNLYL